GVHSHVTIIAPPAQTAVLGTSTYDQACFTLSERSERITSQAASVADAWVGCAAGDAKAHRHICGLVLSDAPHPAILGVRGIRARLVNCWCATRTADFIPAHPNGTASCDRMIDNERFIAAEIAVIQVIHQAVSQRIQLLCGTSLGNTGAAPAG